MERYSIPGSEVCDEEAVSKNQLTTLSQEPIKKKLEANKVSSAFTKLESVNRTCVQRIIVCVDITGTTRTSTQRHEVQEQERSIAPIEHFL
jgi:hypothetical protein